ncbi:hypothetical protein MK489_12440 [Myxococcota bacterium]|nr:hypothetical protein [Myxococcota bacterium]
MRRLLGRDRSAVPEALNLTDDRRSEQRARALAMLDELEREAAFPGPPRVGVTGAPGAGKSTLLDAIVRQLRQRGETVGIAAIDPSSQVSGGALLGDRVRVRSGSGDPGVFIRSMAARDQLGGLADSTRAVVDVMAAVFDRVFVETVGVGQSEADVADLVDDLLFVAQPGAGDTLQFMKAGVLELPDLFVVNKSDLGAVAQRTASELSAGLGFGQHGDGEPREVLLASARDGQGITSVVDSLDALHSRQLTSGALGERRRRNRETFVLATLERRYGSFGIESVGGADALRQRIQRREAASAYGLVDELGQVIEAELAAAQK